MRIEQVEVIVLSIPHPTGHSWDKGELSARGWDQVIVRVRADDGLTGIGEAYHVKNPWAVKAIVEKSLAPILVGQDPTMIERNWQRMFQRVQQTGNAGIAAISGVDTAVHDLISRAWRLPLTTLNGGDITRPIPLYVGGHTLGWRDVDDLDDLVAEARVYVDAGFKALKIRGGRALPDPGDVESVKALREALGDQILILVDANGEYQDLATAIKMARVLDDLGVFWLESPLTFSTAYHAEEIAELSRRVSIRISSGGSTFSRFAYRRLLAAGGVDVLMANTAKAGGISETRKIAAMASAFGNVFSPHSDGGLNAYSNMHLFAAAPPNITDQSFMEWDPIWPFGDVFTNAPIVKDGCAVIADVPGIGTDLRPDAVERFAPRDDTWYKTVETGGLG